MKFMLSVAIAICCLSGCGSNEPNQVERLRRKQQTRELSEANRPRTQQQRLESARRELQLGNVAAAELGVRQLLVEFPDDAKVVLVAAELKAAIGETSVAAEMLESLLLSDTIATEQQDLDITRVAELAAAWMNDLGQPERAEKILRHRLIADPDQVRVHRQLATLLNNLGRRHEAAEHLRFLARQGDASEKELFAMVNLGSAFIDTSVPMPDFSAGLTPAALARAKVLWDNNDPLAARRLVDQLRQQFPDSTPIAAFSLRLGVELDDHQELLGRLTNAPDGIQVEPEYWYALGSLMQRQGKHAEAVRCFGEAVRSDETDRFSYLAMARSLSQLGKETEAEMAVERHDWLSESIRLASAFGNAPGTQSQLQQMTDIMNQLQRPFEAFGWQELMFKRFAGGSSQLDSLRRERQQLSQHDDYHPEYSVASLIELGEWPLPALEQLQGAAAGASNSDRKASGREGDVAVIRFADVAESVGLDFTYLNGDDMQDDAFFLHQQTGGGIGVIDFDRDGWPDLYLTQAGGPPMQASDSDANQFFRNLDGQFFANVTEQTGTGDRGYGQGVAVADINQDGFADLLVANIGPNVLYLNQGDGTFRRQSLSIAEQPDSWTTSIACGDLSRDGLPEIVEVNYVDDDDVFRIPCTRDSEVCNPSRFRPAKDRILTVLADGEIVKWDAGTEHDNTLGRGFAAIIANLDESPGNDLFVANDADENHFWSSRGLAPANQNKVDSITDRKRGLTEIATIRGCATGLRGNRQGSMGLAVGDLDRSGMLDMHVTNFWDQASDLYLQRSVGFFDNVTLSMGTAETSIRTVGWGTQAVDIDRDGWLDLVVLNGHLVDFSHRQIPFRMKPQLFRGGPKRFQEVTADAENTPFFQTATLGRMLAVLDFDRDGRPDFVGNHLDAPVTLLQNRTEVKNWIQFELVGTESERDAVGASVTIVAGDEQWTTWVVGGGGLLCSNEAVLDIGVGQHTKIDEVRIEWPSGQIGTAKTLDANKRYLIVETDRDVFQR